MFIVVYGDIADGFSFVGPFPDATEAAAYMESEDDKSTDMRVVFLHRPDVDERGLKEYADAVHALITA
jgi:hypothetical protein